MKRFGTIAGRLGAFLAVLLLAASIAPIALAVPERPANKYVLDSAGVLTDATERKIIAKNEDLFEKHGAEIVVVAVDFLGGESIEDYTYDLFNDWGIGSAERNNGLLLVLAIGEDNYYAQAGYGIDDYFDAELLGDLLYDYLEDDFADGDYDAGVESVFDALADEVEDYYANDNPYGGAYEDSYGSGDDWGSGGWSAFYVIRTIVTFIVRIVIVLLVVWVIVGFFSSWFGGGRGSGGGGGGGGFWRGMMLGSMLNRRRTYWGAPPPPPPPGPRPGGFGGPPRGGFGGFGGGGGSHGGGAGRSGGFGGGHSGGGFHGGGGSHGGGAGRR